MKEAKLKLTISCIPKNVCFCFLLLKFELKSCFLLYSAQVSNDFPVIDRSFGFDSAVEEAQLSLESAYVEVSFILFCSVRNETDFVVSRRLPVG